MNSEDKEIMLVRIIVMIVVAIFVYIACNTIETTIIKVCENKTQFNLPHSKNIFYCGIKE